jgi:hypothetical protein
MTVRGLCGALAGLIAAIVLVLCLAETRERFGRTEWGMYWTARGRIIRFGIFWPLVYLAAPAIPLGYFIADRARSWMGACWALIGAVVVCGITWLLPTLNPVNDERVNYNTNWMIGLTAALLGGALGAGVWDRYHRRRRAGMPPDE